MAVKYSIQYTSVNGQEYTCNISNPDYIGDEIILEGNVEYGINPLNALDDPIRAKYLRISVRATLDQDLEELLTQGERYWRVELYRGSDKIFFGYITSEQAPQSFVSDTWDLEFDAIDPLGFLEDLAYVDNSGNNYNGYEQFAYIIANCLKRGFESTSERFNILSYVPYDYRTRVNLSTFNTYTSGRFLKLCGIDQDGFIDTDSDEVLSCKEVLEQTLKSLQLTITQINGDTWFISHYLYDSSGLDAKYVDYFDSDGDDLVGTPPNPFSITTIKTDKRTNLATDVIHANQNQQYYFNYAQGKNVVDHKFQYKESMLDNPDLDGATTGVSMPSWTFGDFGYPVDDGTFLVYRQDDSVNLDETAILSDTDLYVQEGQSLKLQIVCQSNFTNAVFRVQIEYTAYTGTTYYVAYGYRNPGVSTVVDRNVPFRWTATESSLSDIFEDAQGNDINDQDFTFTYTLPEIPDLNGILKVRVLSLFAKDTGNTTDYVTVKSIDFSGDAQLLEGSSGVATRTDVHAFKSDKSEIKFNTGGNSCTYNTIIYLGSGRPLQGIVDTLSPYSSYWPLNYLKPQNELTNNKLKRFFTGDFWNFFEPHNIVNIPDLNDNDFRVLEYNFDTASNIGNIKLEENNTDNVPSTATVNNIYKETVKPTIK